MQSAQGTHIVIDKLVNGLERLAVDGEDKIRSANFVRLLQRLGFSEADAVLTCQYVDTDGGFRVSDLIRWMFREDCSCQVSKDMTALVLLESGGEKEYRILPWPNPSKPHLVKYFIYKDQDEVVVPGMELEPTGRGFRALQRLPLSLPSAAEIASWPLDLSLPQFQWNKDLLDKVRPVSAGERPWVIVLMGTPGIGKTYWMKHGTAEQKKAVDKEIGRILPWDNIFFKQIDDAIQHGARAELEKLWAECEKIEDPHECFRYYWSSKQQIFTRFAVDKPDVSESNPKPASYEFRLGVEIVKKLTQPGQLYNVAMETTGLTPGLVKFGLTAPHYAEYHKLVILVEMDDLEQARTITHSRLIREMNSCSMLGGEQFGKYLDVIAEKAKETFKVCEELARTKNKELDDAGSGGGRWHTYHLKQEFGLDPAVQQRIDEFYGLR
eukprot:TRINITY_DN1379_c0_g1_i7.p1 TRINITY_DN1379_c0_g1~~TRINITY_DN1379_c0_g1_i7.p1  ORF type:complete len:438 (+),score=99.10 TRINITY_DN1379_c0_g1_i7:97-1410(+)